jgi:nicotinamide-nucleotide amidase
VKLGFRAHFPEIQIKLTVKGSDVVEARDRLDAATAEVMRRVGVRVFSDGAPMEEVVAAALAKAGAMVATAEGSAGGVVTEMLTRLASSSACVERGFVAPSDRAKIDVLGVGADLLRDHGGASEQAARAMAEGAVARAGVTHALAMSDIGEGGAVFVALAAPDGTFSRRLRWPMLREQVRAIAAMAALDLLRRSLAGLSLDDPDLPR